MIAGHEHVRRVLHDDPVPSRVRNVETLDGDVALAEHKETVRRSCHRRARAGCGREDDRGARRPGRSDVHQLGVGRAANLDRLPRADPRGGGADRAERLLQGAATGVRAEGVRIVDIEHGPGRGWRRRIRAERKRVEHRPLRAGHVVARGWRTADRINPHPRRRHRNPQVLEVHRADGGARVGRLPGRLERGRATGRDVRDAADRLKPLVVVRVAVDIEHVLRILVRERAEDVRECDVTSVQPSGVRRTVPEGDDELDRRVVLCCREDRVDLRLPVRPRRAGVPLGVRDVAHGPDVEPAPVLPAAAEARRVRRGPRVRDLEATLVVPQVVARRRLPFVVAPRRHVRGLSAPRHHVVEVLVDGGLPIGIGVRDVAGHEDERRAVGGNLALHRRRGRVVGR